MCAQLNVWLVAPFVVAELIRLCVNLGVLVAGMLILKKNSLDLGPLMGGSCGGGFFMRELLVVLATVAHAPLVTKCINQVEE